MTDPDCPMCRKLARVSDEEPVWQFPYSVAFLGPWQFFHGYSVLVAREHATELFHLQPAARRAFLDELTVLAHAIAEAFQPLKLNYELLGNQVPHLHWHVFPRYAEDPDRNDPVWPRIYRAGPAGPEYGSLCTGPLDRAATAGRLRQHLTRLTTT